jgi:LAO/AO transport system kinase
VRDLELLMALGNESIRALSRARGHATHTAADAHVKPGEGAQETGARWTPPIVKCTSTRGEGIAALVAALDAHHAWVDGTEAGRARHRARLVEEVRDALRQALIEAATHDLGPQIDAAVRDVDARAIDPYTATERLVDAFRRREGSATPPRG